MFSSFVLLLCFTGFECFFFFFLSFFLSVIGGREILFSGYCCGCLFDGELMGLLGRESFEEF